MLEKNIFFLLRSVFILCIGKIKPKIEKSQSMAYPASQNNWLRKLSFVEFRVRDYKFHKKLNSQGTPRNDHH
jgi:hypothetical protein